MQDEIDDTSSKIVDSRFLKDENIKKKEEMNYRNQNDREKLFESFNKNSKSFKSLIENDLHLNNNSSEQSNIFDPRIEENNHLDNESRENIRELENQISNIFDMINDRSTNEQLNNNNVNNNIFENTNNNDNDNNNNNRAIPIFAGNAQNLPNQPNQENQPENRVRENIFFVFIGEHFDFFTLFLLLMMYEYKVTLLHFFSSKIFQILFTVFFEKILSNPNTSSSLLQKIFLFFLISIFFYCSFIFQPSLFKFHFSLKEKFDLPSIFYYILFYDIFLRFFLIFRFIFLISFFQNLVNSHKTDFLFFFSCQ